MMFIIASNMIMDVSECVVNDFCEWKQIDLRFCLVEILVDGNLTCGAQILNLLTVNLLH